MQVKGKAAYFLEPDTDTDVIIPARFLKRTELDGFEQFSFFEKRYSAETVCEATLEEKDFVFQKKVFNPDCPLNKESTQGAEILLTWKNFGCGSSREHAVYALRNYKVIIGSAPAGTTAFADIFRDNCRQNLIWTPVISETDHSALTAWLKKNLESGPVELVLDSDKRVITNAAGDFAYSFDIPQSHVDYILGGKDPFEMAREQITSYNSDIDTWMQKQDALYSKGPLVK